MNKYLDGTEIEQNQLNAVLERIISNQPIQIPMQCPICLCQPYSLRVYFHSRGSNRVGGVWVWCNNCGHYLHGTIKPPEWWFNLDSVKLEFLESAPDYLDTLVDKIDRHWLIINSCSPSLLVFEEDYVSVTTIKPLGKRGQTQFNLASYAKG